MPGPSLMDPGVGPERESIISRLTHRYPWVNGMASVAEIIAGVATRNGLMVFDGMHGAAELLFARGQIKDAHNHDEVAGNRRKMLYGGLFSAALVGVGASIADAANGAEIGSQGSIAWEAAGLAASGLAAATAIGARRSMRRRATQKYGGSGWKDQLTPTEHDAYNHIGRLDAPVSGATFATAVIGFAGNLLAAKTGLQDVVHVLQGAIGVAGSAWGAWLFRPTQANLSNGGGPHIH